ncbi:hypothetical protein [Novosphingobium sp.]|uniref:hypothetical protein n=1 Tax=Novosphingobium sp. TaxID=1874826 RepID=UPI00260AF473|nr:hypothetical protein [Novosphingobium sp.]
MTKPLSPPDFVPVKAMEDVMAIRSEQIFRHGHTPESDARLPLHHFARQLHGGAIRIEEDAQFNLDLEVMRRRVVKHAALCLALIDRIDAERRARCGEVDHG